MKKLLSFVLFLSISLGVFGAYLEKIPTQLVQPNGEVLHLFMTGDEFYNRVHDSEGYTIVQGADGWYYYAMYDAENDDLIPSGHLVTASGNMALPMDKGLSISHEKYMKIRRDFFEPTGCEPSGASKKSILNDLANNGVKTTQQMNNIVICIGFSDTPQMGKSYSYVDGLFNSNAGNNMRDYFFTMSYEKLDLASHFYPPADGNVLRFYKDSHPRSYFQPYNATTNPNGYTDSQRAQREQTLLRDAVNWVNANWPVPTDINLDINNDGECDFISFVIQGAPGAWSSLLWPHKWSLYLYTVKINGKRVMEYNFELDGDNTYFSTNVFCHEGYHVLGAPDLYHYDDAYPNQAAGKWDIMDDPYLTKPQSMSAYMKFKYGNWISTLPVATINKTYEVYPFYTNDGSNPDKQIFYRIPMTGTSTQYSVVEYRKKAGTNYDNYIPNQGLLIYRINSLMSGNAGFNGNNYVDEVYLYRNGSSQTSGVYTQGDLSQAPYNPTNGKTAFNSTTNPKPCQSNGTAETTQNINNILYDSNTDSYTFFYGDPANREISVNKTTLLLEVFEGATGTVTITSNVVWNITIPSDATDWLTVSKTKGINTGTVTFSTLSPNSGTSQRTTVVTITGNGQTFNVTVNQEVVEVGYIVVGVSANPAAGGSVSGGGVYPIGDPVEVDATANTGYEFANWTKAGAVVSTIPLFSFSASEIVELVANFTINTYTVSVSANNTAGGDVTGGGTFEHGQSATVKATAKTGYYFVNWTKEGTEVSTNANYTFQVFDNVDLVANFTKLFIVTVSANPAAGGTVSGGGSYKNETITVKAKPNSCYDFENWTVNGVVMPAADANYTFLVTQDTELVANFKIKSFTVTVLADTLENGSVTGGGTYDCGVEVTVCATANEGNVFVNWIKNSVVISTNPCYTFPATEDVTLTAHFEKIGGVETQCIASLQVYPNPTTGELYIQSSKFKVQNVEVYDVYGRKCHVSRVTCHENIDISNLSNGIYFVKIYTEDGVVVKKVIKH